MEVKKKAFLARQMQKRYGIDDEKKKQYLDKEEKLEFDLNEVEKKSPVKLESTRKIKRMTEKIIDENKAIDRLLRREKPREQTRQKPALAEKSQVQQQLHQEKEPVQQKAPARDARGITGQIVAEKPAVPRDVKAEIESARIKKPLQDTALPKIDPAEPIKIEAIEIVKADEPKPILKLR
jgi:hypothetical protein